MSMFSSGDICHHLGVSMTVDFITNTLDVKPDATDKRAALYTAESFDKICTALVERIADLRHSTPSKKPKAVKKVETPAAADPKSFDDDEL